MYRPFRPRFARWTSLTVGAAVALFMIGLAVAVPMVRDASWGDSVGIATVGLAVAWFLMRHGTVRAVPDEHGLVVRNLLVTRKVEWAQIVTVRFSQGHPWVQLDLADGDTLAVMGIQSSDGVRATVEASRLATLVALHSVTGH